MNIYEILKSKNLDNLKSFLEQNNDINGLYPYYETEDSQDTILIMAIKASSSIEIIRFLICHRDIDINKKHNDMNALITAICMRRIDILNLLLDEGKGIDLKINEDNAFIHESITAVIASNDTLILEILLQKLERSFQKSDFLKYINFRTTTDTSALAVAFEMGSLDAIKLLISKGTDIKSEDPMKILLYSIISANDKVIEYALLNISGRNVNLKDSKYVREIFQILAEEYRGNLQKEILEYLLEVDVDPFCYTEYLSGYIKRGFDIDTGKISPNFHGELSIHLAQECSILLLNKIIDKINTVFYGNNNHDNKIKKIHIAHNKAYDLHSNIEESEYLYLKNKIKIISALSNSYNEREDLLQRCMINTFDRLHDNDERNKVLEKEDKIKLSQKMNSKTIKEEDFLKFLEELSKDLAANPQNLTVMNSYHDLISSHLEKKLETLGELAQSSIEALSEKAIEHSKK